MKYLIDILLWCYKMFYLYITVCRIQRLLPAGEGQGVGGHFSDVQETTLIYMVSANSGLKLGEIQNRVL